MTLATTLPLLLLSISSTFGSPIYQSTSHQLVFSSPQSQSSPSPPIYPLDYWSKEEGVGHFSEWSKATKRSFIDDVTAGKAGNWTVVMGNEGGDLDSMAAALTWAYHLSHSHPDTPAVALLQTPEDALDLRPENKLALSNVKMSPGHRDLLTIDELPIKPKELSTRLRGIVLVDHPVPLSVWKEAKILSIFDHHTDRGVANETAKPRIFERTASCTTIVSREMLDELEKLKVEYHVPHEVFELALSAIALDSDALSRGLPTDRTTSRRMFDRSNFKLNDSRSFMDVMDDLDSQMGKAKKALDELSVRDLLRRDWKGDLVHTPSDTTPSVHLGFASIPYSLSDQIERTLHNTTEEWFQIEQQWSHEISADISLALNSFKEEVDRNGNVVSRTIDWDDDEDLENEEDEEVGILKKRKVREIVLVVRHDHRINEEQADSLFKVVTDAIEKSEILAAKRWSREAELGKRQMVYVHHVESGGRKLIRPLVEDAISAWTM